MSFCVRCEPKSLKGIQNGRRRTKIKKSIPWFFFGAGGSGGSGRPLGDRPGKNGGFLLQRSFISPWEMFGKGNVAINVEFLLLEILVSVFCVYVYLFFLCCLPKQTSCTGHFGFLREFYWDDFARVNSTATCHEPLMQIITDCCG